MFLKRLLILCLLTGTTLIAQSIKLNELEARKGQELQKQSQQQDQIVSRLFSQYAKLTANMGINSEKELLVLQQKLKQEQTKQANINSFASKWCNDVIISRKQDTTKMTCDWANGQLIPIK